MTEVNTDRKLTKNEKRRLKEKEEKEKAKNAPITSAGIVRQQEGGPHSSVIAKSKRASRFLEPEEHVTYVSADVDSILQSAIGANSKVVIDAAALDEFKSMFNQLAKAEDLTNDDREGGGGGASSSRLRSGGRKSGNEDGSVDISDSDGDGDADMDTNDAAETEALLSKKQQRMARRPTIAQLKQLVGRPEVVEAHDVTAADPQLLLYLKCLRNSVPVPLHWGARKKYLSGKRGVEKPPFELPAFIADTGIDKIRESLLAQDEAKRSKAKARSRTRPSMGKIDIDYQVLHDAFFKFQTKPLMSKHGELYYEGKELEVGGHLKNRRPGGPLSDTLLHALGMASNNVPPPWLLSQQRYGPPPSYPHLKIPGLSAPLPLGGQFGYHAGGWGKPPVDEYGRPLYGDVFGTGVGLDEGDTIVDVGTKWGEMQADEEEASDMDDVSSTDDSESSDADEAAAAAQLTFSQIMAPPPGIGATVTVDALQAMAQETIDLRKRAAATAGAGEKEKEKTLYQVLETRDAGAGSKQGKLFAVDKVYIMDGGGGGTAPPQQQQQQAAVEAESSAAVAGGGGGGGEADAAPGAAKRRKASRSDAAASARSLDDFKF